MLAIPLRIYTFGGTYTFGGGGPSGALGWDTHPAKANASLDTLHPHDGIVKTAGVSGRAAVRGV